MMTDVQLPTDVHAVLFDMDGTLVDSLEAWFLAAEQLWGQPIPRDTDPALLGGTISDVVDLYIEHHPGTDPDDVATLIGRLIEDNLAHGVPAMPGADDLVRRLAGRVPIAVASNSPSRLVHSTLAGQRWTGLFGAELGLDDVERGKPDPDLYLAAAATFDADITRCVVVEDSPTGVDAGRAAGAFVLAVGSVVEGAGDLWVPSLDDSRVRSWAPTRPR
nr:HAD family phosphatase [Acidipropionibacterium timonense]